MFDIGVFTMRARPFGPQHLYNIEEGLKQARVLFVIVGSAFEPINFRNPFTEFEVCEMVRGSLNDEQNERVFLFGMPDFDSDLRWVTQVQQLVKSTADSFGWENPSVALVGHVKDESGYYLRMFPQWGRIGTANWQDGYSSTGIRKALYERPESYVEMGLPKGTEVFLRQWIHSEAYIRMQAEYFFNKEEASKFPPHPYHGEGAAFHLTADMCMFQAGGVILVRRGDMPGEGLWALPGGHINYLERFEDAAVRELIEETDILKLNEGLEEQDIRQAIRGSKLLDNPWRSTRMRTVGMAYGGILPGSTRLLVQGADDAKEARFWNIDEITREMMFEDHYLIIEHFTNTLDLR